MDPTLLNNEETYSFNLKSSIVLHNALPYELSIKILDQLNFEDSFSLKAGKQIEVKITQPNKPTTLVLNLNYLDQEWVFTKKLNSLNSLQVAEFVNSKGGQSIRLGWNQISGQFKFTLYNPVWLINKSDYELTYRYLNVLERMSHQCYLKMCPPKTNNFNVHQPLLVDFEVSQIFLATFEENQ